MEVKSTKLRWYRWLVSRSYNGLNTWILYLEWPKRRKKSKTCIWKKRSIFFDLPYWSDLDIRHCIDVMHVEKNMCDSVIGTLLNIQGKTKDGLNTRQYLTELGIRSQLHPRSNGKNIILASSLSYFVKKEENQFLSMSAGGQSPTRILFKY